MNFFDRANAFINGAENSAVNFFSAVAPWLAPLVPMQITIEHMTGYLGFNLFVAWSAGLVVEIMGLASVSTILRLWRHNQKQRAETNKQPLWLPIFVYLFYLVVILAVVALPEFSKDNPDWIAVGVKLLLCLLSVPAAITLAIRAQNTEIVTEIQERKAEKVYRKIQPERTENLPKVSESKDWRKLPDEDKSLVADMPVKQIQSIYNLSERTARNWKANAALNGKQPAPVRNGNGEG